MPAVADAARTYKAHGTAHQLWICREPEVVMSGPAGTGKSRANLEKLHACCLRWPGSRWLIVRKTRESLTESGLVTFEEKVLPHNSPIKAGPQRKMRQAYHYPNGSEVVVGGLDKPSKVMSTEYDGIYVQEAIELHENDWESLTTRLRNGVMPFQQLIADTNPDAATHWLKRRADAGSCLMLESRHEDNPTLWRDGGWTDFGRTYIATLDRLTGVRRDRLRYGKWVSAEGMVYDGWDRAVHLIDRFPIPPSWTRIRVTDFGYINPHVTQWWAIDGDGRMYRYREIYRSKRLVSDHTKDILRLSQGERITADVSDHDAEDRATMEASGIRTVAAYKAVRPGIENVQDRLKIQGDGKPRLFLLRDSLVERDEELFEAKRPCSTEEEFEVYTYAKGQDGRPMKDEPVKLNDHGMDAMRYAAAYLDRLGSGPPPRPALAGGHRPTPPAIPGVPQRPMGGYPGGWPRR